MINGRSRAHLNLIETCSPDRILVESDYNDISFCTQRTWDMVNIVAGIKKWTVEKQWNDELQGDEIGAVHMLEENWRAFKAGKHEQRIHKTRRKRRRLDLQSHDDVDVASNEALEHL